MPVDIVRSCLCWRVLGCLIFVGQSLVNNAISVMLIGTVAVMSYLKGSAYTAVTGILFMFPAIAGA